MQVLAVFVRLSSVQEDCQAIEQLPKLQTASSCSATTNSAASVQRRLQYCDAGLRVSAGCRSLFRSYQLKSTGTRRHVHEACSLP